MKAYTNNRALKPFSTLGDHINKIKILIGGNNLFMKKSALV